MTTADEDRIAARQAEAIRLRVRGKTIRAIAAELGISVGQAHLDVRTAMTEIAKEAEDNVQAQRGLELSRLERALDVIENVLNGTGVGEPGSGDELQLKALDRLVKIQDQRAKLLGLYAPTKQEHSGPDGAPIAVDARSALLERLAGLANPGAGAEETAPDSGEPDASGS